MKTDEGASHSPPAARPLGKQPFVGHRCADIRTARRRAVRQSTHGRSSKHSPWKKRAFVMRLSTMFTTSGGMLWPILSRRSVIFCITLFIALSAPFPASLFTMVGRFTTLLILAAVTARITASWIPRPTLSDVGRRAVLVTGCSSGLGFDMALALDAAGALVVGACRNPQAEGPRLLQRLASSRLRLLRMDVCDQDSIAAAVDQVHELLEDRGVLWAIVNNAGEFAAGDCEMVDIDSIKRILDLNTLGALRVTRAFLPLLKLSKGRVVNMISILCRFAPAFHLPYTMSKHASLALTESMRQELSRYDISVHSIEPWFYKTPMITNKNDKIQEMWTQSPEEAKNAENERLIEGMKKISDWYLDLITFPPHHIKRVSDTVVDACLALDPKMRYVPSFAAELAAGIISNVPFVNNIIHHILFKMIEEVRK